MALVEPSGSGRLGAGLYRGLHHGPFGLTNSYWSRQCGIDHKSTRLISWHEHADKASRRTRAAILTVDDDPAASPASPLADHPRRRAPTPETARAHYEPRLARSRAGTCVPPTNRSTTRPGTINPKPGRPFAPTTRDITFVLCAGLSDAGKRLGSEQSVAPGEPVRGPEALAETQRSCGIPLAASAGHLGLAGAGAGHGSPGMNVTPSGAAVWCGLQRIARRRAPRSR